MNKIKLGSIVAVSDPCYEKPELKLDNVLSGYYVPVVRHLSLEDWGNRIGALVCVHESFFGNELTWWEHDAIGVDSGQAGVFSMDTYQNDEKVKGLTPYDFKGNAPDIEDFWYRVCCNMTISEPGWGTYNQGVVSSSGLGDGCYDVYVAKHEGKIVGIHIDFGIYEDPDFHFYLTP